MITPNPQSFNLRSFLQNNGTRRGALSLRQQRLSVRMLAALRLEATRVHMSLVSYEKGSTSTAIPTDQAGSRFLAPPDKFVYLRTKVINLAREYQPKDIDDIVQR